jgi:arylsulfatase A-like enzyme
MVGNACAADPLVPSSRTSIARFRTAWRGLPRKPCRVRRTKASTFLQPGGQLLAAIIGLALPFAYGPVHRAEAAPTAPTEKDRPPNILLIVTDDQRAEGTLDVMPKTRYWFEQGGTRFSNAFATTPLCCPGRASLFSGRYAHNHGVRTNGEFRVVAELDQRSTIQRYLQEAGYRTALMGKFFYSWNLSLRPPFVDDWALFRAGYNDIFFRVNGQGQRVSYSTDFISERSVDFLHKTEEHDKQPWFLYIGTHAPHLSPQPAPAYEQAAVPPWTGDPAVFEADRTDKAPWVATYNPPYGDIFAGVQSIRERQLRTLMSVDDLVGNVFDTVEALGEGQNTIAVFLSDNGYMWGDHSLGAEKRFPYTPSVQIPLFIRWPGHIAAGAIDPRLAANVDVAPTVLGAARLSADPKFRLDGRSLLAPQVRDRLLLEYWRSPDGGPPPWASIRTGTYQYIEWYSDEGGALTFREFYDLVADPWQLQNLLADADPANDPDVASLSAQLASDRACAGRPCSPTGAVSAETLDGNDVRGQLDLARLAYRRADAGNPLKVRVATQRGWRTNVLRRGGSSRLLVQIDLDGDSRPEYRVRIVLTGRRLRAWIIEPSGRIGSLRVRKPNRRMLTFSIPGRSPANPDPGAGINLRARSRFFDPGSKCHPACVDWAPDQGFGPRA